MSSYDGEPHDVFGYLYGIQWKNLTPEQIISLESGYKFDTDIEILIAKEEIKDTIEHFYQNKIDKFAWEDEVGRLKLIYTLVRLSNQLPTEFSKTKENQISRVVLAMRLHNRGLVLNNIAFSLLQGVLEYYVDVPKTDYLKSYKFPWGQPYKIAFEDLEQIKEIYELTKKPHFTKNEGIKKAIRRLNDYYTDLDKHKKLVSVYTGLEVLLKDNKPRKNIKGHLAKECIKRISKNRQESLKIKSVIIDGYDYRSGILHDDKEIESKKLDDVLEKCVEYLCRLLFQKMKDLPK